MVQIGSVRDLVSPCRENRDCDDGVEMIEFKC